MWNLVGAVWASVTLSMAAMWVGLEDVKPPEGLFEGDLLTSDRFSEKNYAVLVIAHGTVFNMRLVVVDAPSFFFEQVICNIVFSLLFVLWKTQQALIFGALREEENKVTQMISWSGVCSSSFIIAGCGRVCLAVSSDEDCLSRRDLGADLL